MINKKYEFYNNIVDKNDLLEETYYIAQITYKSTNEFKIHIRLFINGFKFHIQNYYG